MMPTIEKLEPAEMRGFSKLFRIPVKVTVKPESYLHIGATGSPTREKKAPIFLIKNEPVIPGSSFKGAWRSRLEDLIEADFDALCAKFALSGEQREHFRPCIPSPAPSVTKAEREKFKGKRKLASCQIAIEEERVRINGGRDRLDKTLCPVCYLFGCNGLMGFLRVPNLTKVLPAAQRAVYEQTNIRRDRAVDGVAHRALVTGEQVEPGTEFEGGVELLLDDGTFKFGEVRKIGDVALDRWLEPAAQNQGVDKVAVTIVNALLLPALEKIDILGGQRSKGGGQVIVKGPGG